MVDTVPTQSRPAAPESPVVPARSAIPELLAPAGDWECARAAVENGADAIYFGLSRFNARMRAHNFTEADLPGLMAFLHHRGVKGYVTFNTLVFENELAEAEQFARSIIAAGVDAAIIQDVGVCLMLRRLSPDFPIHASTQMTVTSAAGLRFARELGCDLVVLARECPLGDIERIRAAQGGDRLPIEVFVHGALCVAYSGQCLTSEALGGRSANRGECAQACRMPYELLCDGQPVPLGDRKYLLSPQDLAGLDLLPEMARIGIASLKIEGRLKSREYVANITRVYRQALDRLGGRVVPAGESISPASAKYRMEMAFSRGLFTGWFGGINNQALVHGRFGTKRGVFLGEVASVRGDAVTVPLVSDLKPGDGVVFDAGHPEQKEEGGRVYEVRAVRAGRGEGLAELRFGTGDVDFARIHAGDKLWKTSDPELERRLRQTFEGDIPRHLRDITAETHGTEGAPLVLVLRDEQGRLARVESAPPLQKAERQPLTTQRLKDQIGRLGGTPFRLAELHNQIEGDLILPVSELNRMRREAVAELERRRSEPLRWTLHPGRTRNETVAAPRDAQTEPELIVLARTLDQIEAAVACGVRRVYCEFEDIKKYRGAVESFRKLTAGMAGAEIFVAPPRIFKMGEDWTLQQVRSCEADGYLVRNYDHLEYFERDRKIGDYSLNVANHISAEYFLARHKLERVTASYDLNFSQLEAMLRSASPGLFDVTIHQHMPMFHMEHCVFCAFLTTGRDYRDCGRPCDRHELQMKDRVGALHTVKADAGCRNTVFNGLAQTGAEYAQAMIGLGVRHFRVEFLTEKPDSVRATVRKYQQLLRGEITGNQLWRDLRLFNQLGVTRGQIGR
jgi:putative protease